VDSAYAETLEAFTATEMALRCAVELTGSKATHPQELLPLQRALVAERHEVVA